MGTKRKLRWQLFGLGLFALIVGVIAYPNETAILRQIGIERDFGIRRGLDLQGGVELIYEADVPEEQDSSEAMEQTAAVIRKRINPTGASEAVIQLAQNNRLIVQIPGEENPETAIELIGRTAELAFLEIDFSQEASEEQVRFTDVSGADVARARAGYDQFNRPIVSLEFRSGESTSKFAELTTRIYNSGTQVLTTLDGQPVFGPAPVSEPILTGESQLTGMESIQEAQEIATLLNAGALPVPIELSAQQTVGPSLGANATQASVIAGLVGLTALVIFMLAVYRLGGAVGVVMIVLYAATMVTIFKLSAVELFSPAPIVLTLAGIAGFIMSIAVAADANILVLERLREERRAGLSPVKAVESGFNHAWSSIRDASISTLIICVILYTLASRFGESSIQGFALVLGLGVAANVFSAAVITRTLLRGMARTRFGGRL